MAKKSYKRKKESSQANSDSQDPLLLSSIHTEIVESIVEYPLNKDLYRYYLAEPDPNAIGPNFDWSTSAGKPIPGNLYRVRVPQEVSLSSHDRAHQIQLSTDRMSVSGHKGYSLIRGSHGVSYGAWYFEMKFVSLPSNSAVRVGWSQQQAILQAPCGYDKFGYSCRSLKGTIFHESIGRKYCHGGFSENDVIGMYIYLPKEDTCLSEYLPDSHKQNVLIKFKNHFYFEERQSSELAEKKLKPAEGSKIIFFKNGVCQGLAFKDIYAGRYYPSISLYQDASVTANFGPNFEFPPSMNQLSESLVLPRPMCGCVDMLSVEQILADIYYLAMNQNSTLPTSHDLQHFKESRDIFDDNFSPSRTQNQSKRLKTR